MKHRVSSFVLIVTLVGTTGVWLLRPSALAQLRDHTDAGDRVDGTHARAVSIWYVDDDAAGGDGTSWASAFKYLQDALGAAAADDSVYVAGGTYFPDENTAQPGGSGDQAATFHLISGVSLLGGRPGQRR